VIPAEAESELVIIVHNFRLNNSRFLNILYYVHMGAYTSKRKVAALATA